MTDGADKTAGHGSDLQYLRNRDLRERISRMVGVDPGSRYTDDHGAGIPKDVVTPVARELGVERVDDRDLEELYRGICDQLDVEPPQSSGNLWGLRRAVLKEIVRELRSGEETERGTLVADGGEDAGPEITHDTARDDSVCGVFCDNEPEVSFEAFGYTFHRCRDCYEEPCSRCGEEIEDDSNKPKGWCQSCREEIRLICGGDEERGIQKDEDSEQTTLITDGGHRHATDRIDGQLLVECPEDADHLSVSVEVTNSEKKPSELFWLDECRICGAELAYVEETEPTEVLE